MTPRQPSGEARPGIVNFRDCGGPPGDAGRTVKRGMLYRGTALWNTGEADLELLSRLGIGLVVDLRSHAETRGRPDRCPEGASLRHLPAVPSMDALDQEALDWDVYIDAVSRSEQALEQAEAFQYGVYTEMIRCPGAFSALVQDLLDHPDRPVYIHCSAGKDRTGVACAIVLRLLGVALDDIMADYMASADNPQPEVASVLDKASTMSPRIEALLRVMTGVSPDRLQSAWDEVDRVWGGWDGFVRDGLGLTAGDVSRLRDQLLDG